MYLFLIGLWGEEKETMVHKRKILLRASPNQLESDAKFGEDQLAFLVMNIPFACNYTCSKCYRKNSTSQDSIPLQKRLDVISKSRDLGAKVLCIPGEGEPLTNQRLTLNLLRHAKSLGMDSVLYTNASLLNKDLTTELLGLDVSLVTSLDSLTSSTYAALTGGHKLDSVLSNLTSVREIYSAAKFTRSDGYLQTSW